MFATSRDLEAQLAKVRDLESRLTFQMSVLSKLLDQQSAALLKDTGISLTAYRILNVVDTFGAISISDISRVTALDRAQISRMAETLAQSGHVVFSGDPHHRKKKNVQLTPQGCAFLSEVQPRFRERNAALTEKLGPDAAQALRDGLSKLSEVFSAAQGRV